MNNNSLISSPNSERIAVNSLMFTYIFLYINVCICIIYQWDLYLSGRYRLTPVTTSKFQWFHRIVLILTFIMVRCVVYLVG